MASEELLYKPHLNAIGGVRLQDLHAPFIGFGTRPVLLEFKEKLERCQRDSTSLN